MTRKTSSFLYRTLRMAPTGTHEPLSVQIGFYKKAASKISDRTLTFPLADSGYRPSSVLKQGRAGQHNLIVYSNLTRTKTADGSNVYTGAAFTIDELLVAPPKILGLTAANFDSQFVGNVQVIFDVAKKSGNLKGTFIKSLKDAPGVIESATEKLVDSV